MCKAACINDAKAAIDIGPTKYEYGHRLCAANSGWIATASLVNLVIRGNGGGVNLNL